MLRATRLTGPLRNFEIPEMSCKKIVTTTVTAVTGNTGGTGGARATANSDPATWQETPDHGNYNPTSNIGQTVSKRRLLARAIMFDTP